MLESGFPSESVDFLLRMEGVMLERRVAEGDRAVVVEWTVARRLEAEALRLTKALLVIEVGESFDFDRFFGYVG